jgi:hypothetical protein
MNEASCAEQLRGFEQRLLSKTTRRSRADLEELLAVDFVELSLLRDGEGKIRVEHGRHVAGVFAQEDWLRMLRETGFEASVVPFDHSEVEPGSLEVFVGHRPQDGEKR